MSNALTPEALRRNAVQQLTDAQALLGSSPRNAAYLAGYAIEFMLKARYCALRGWATFPATVAELKSRNAQEGVVMTGRLFVHDLDELLRLSKTDALKPHSFHRIDWERACDWSEEIRYLPDHAVTREEAAELIAEVQKVVEELMCFEIVNHLLAIERELTDRFGLFHCFAYVINPNTKQWIVLVSWQGRTQVEADARLTELRQAINERIPSDLRTRVAETLYLEPAHPILQSLYSVLAFVGTGLLHSPRSMLARNTVIGLPNFPDGFVITGGKWAQALLDEAWAKATYVLPAEAGGEA